MGPLFSGCAPVAIESGGGEQLIITRGALAASVIPFVDIFQLHPQNGGLKSIEAAVPSEFFMKVAARAAVIAQRRMCSAISGLFVVTSPASP